MDVPVVDRTRRRETQTPAHQAPPCTLVNFGAGGDLTRRLLMPAIYNLSRAKLLSNKFAIIAVDRTPKPIEPIAIIWQRGSGALFQIPLQAPQLSRSTRRRGNSSRPG